MTCAFRDSRHRYNMVRLSKETSTVLHTRRRSLLMQPTTGHRTLHQPITRTLHLRRNITHDEAVRGSA